MSKEKKAIQNLLQCSEKAEEDLNDFQRVVDTFSWHEVATGWRNSAPNVIYQSSERKKKSKEKQSKTTPISGDHENHYQKVRKLAGMLANGAVPVTKRAKSNMLKFKNLDVLSYDIPCWRYILDPRTCSYVERKPLQHLRNVNEKKRRTTVLENGGVVSFQEINGEALFVDPALNFDRHLLKTLENREEFRLKSDIFCRSLDVPKVCSSLRTENNRIRVVHTGFATSMSPRVEIDGPRDVTCRQNTQTDSNTKELKPLQKVTPIQRRAAEDSILASKMLMARARAKELKSESSMQILNKKTKISKNKCTELSNPSRVDWVPITASTFHYQTHSTAYENPMSHFHGKPGRNFKYSKTVSLRPFNDSKENKLTLNEVANLMPSENVSTTVDKLAKELESKKDRDLEIGMELSPDLLPTVMGKKLLMTSETRDNFWSSL